MSTYSAVPSVLTKLPNWVVWKHEKRDGKITKVPYNARTGHKAKADDASTWASFQEACEAADILTGDGNYDGIGFELGGTDIGGLDLDNAYKEGVIDRYASQILWLLGNPYTEVSPSGEGLHAFFQCPALPQGGRKLSKGHDGIEIYHGREKGRYFTITGNHVQGEGVPPVADISLAYFLITQNRDKKFKNLWLGSATDFGDDESKADFHLMLRLAQFTNNDEAKMEEYFGLSGLGTREKWTDRKDYRERTIKAAVEAARTGKTDIDGSELKFNLPAVVANRVTVGNVTTTLDFVIAPPEGQKDGWFPLGQPSIIAGSSGGAKTTWMLQMLLAQSKNEQFLGHATYGRPFVILAVDRGEDAYGRTILRMHLENDIIPHRFMPPTKIGAAALQEIVNQIEATNPMPEIAFIEGGDYLVEDGNNKREVAEFMSGLQTIAKYYHLAAILSVGAPKSKVGQGYAAKRDNVAGTGAWSRSAETVVTIQYPSGDDMANEREVSVQPRNCESEKFAMVFNKEGRLQLQTEDDKLRAAGKTLELDWAREQAWLAHTNPEKEWWTVTDMQQELEHRVRIEALPKGKKAATSYATIDRWVKNAHTKCWIVQKPGKKGRGKAALYQWNDSKTNPFHKSNPDWFVTEHERVFDNEDFNSVAVN